MTCDKAFNVATFALCILPVCNAAVVVGFAGEDDVRVGGAE
jgi:hypothetical protein